MSNTVIHSRSYGLLRKLAEFCRTEDIPFILCGGSLLGAVRHRGIIPWDDDIDVAMRRCDYDRLVAKIRENPPPGTFWYSTETDPLCPYHHGKFCERATDIVLRDCPLLKMPRSLAVDVFPLDGLPDGAIARRLFWWLSSLLNRFQMLLSDAASPRHHRLKVVFRLLISPFITRQAVQTAYLKLAHRFPSSQGHDLVCTCTNYTYRQEVYFADWLDRTCEMAFGESDYPAPADFHSYLVRHYGSQYMRPSRSVSETVGHYRMLTEQGVPDLPAFLAEHPQYDGIVTDKGMFFWPEVERLIGFRDDRLVSGTEQDYFRRALKMGLNVFVEQPLPKVPIRRDRHPRYDFSVVLAAYNVASYLEAAVDSLRQQTVGFGRIQVILVDDGSTDGTSAICDRLAVRYPENVLALHQPNGGVSSARNLGVRHALGRFVNFMDSDDLFDADTFSAVRDFFDQHYHEIDVVAVRTYYFEGRTGAKNTNFRFKQRDPITCSHNRIADLELEPLAFQHVTNSSFVRRSVAQQLEFDTRLRYHEDVAYMVRVMARARRMGLVSVGAYRQRKREAGGSATQIMDADGASYLPTAEIALNGSLDWLSEHEHEIPAYAESTLLFANEYKTLLPEYPASLDGHDRMRYESLLQRGFSRISDEAIFRAKIPMARRYACLYYKYGTLPNFQVAAGKNLERAACGIDFVEVRPTELVIEFRIYPFGRLPDGMRCGLLVRSDAGQEEFAAGVMRERWQVHSTLGHKLSLVTMCVRTVLPLSDGCTRDVMPVIVGPDGVRHRLTINFAKTAPLTEKLPEQKCIRGSWQLSIVQGQTRCEGLRIEPRRFCNVAASELRLLAMWWRRRWNPVTRKALAMRIACHILRRFKRRPIWIVSDRALMAGDNGQAFFEYLMGLSSIRTNPKVYFCLSHKSPDFSTVRKLGRTVEPMSYRHQILFMLSDLIISSQATPAELAAYSGNMTYNCDIARRHRFVFLQHGITKDDLSGWANRWNHDARIFVTAASPEYDSILNGNYGYTGRELRLTGFPRFDRLLNNPRKVITVMPTWRRALVSMPDKITGQRMVNPGFENTTFFHVYTELLADADFVDACVELGYTLQYALHPEISSAKRHFRLDPRVHLVPPEKAYREIFAETDLLVTDYSSTAFDFAYLRKPVVYLQADRDEFFRGHTYRPGYFSYEKDGFGEVVDSVPEMKRLILDYLSSGCTLKSDYRARIDRFFPHGDRNNSARVYEAVQEIVREMTEEGEYGT